MRAAAAVLPGDCPDAEVLGLYAERALDDDAERVAVDAHVTGCARCQAIVAAYVQSLPSVVGSAGVAPAVVTGWFSGWRWLVPLASAAAVGVVAVWIGRSPSDEAAERTATRPAVKEYDSSVSAQVVPAPQDAVPPAAALPGTTGLARQEAAGARRATPPLKSAVPSVGLADAASNRDSRERRDTRPETEAMARPTDATEAAAATAPAEAPAAAAPPLPASRSASGTTSAGVAAGQPLTESARRAEQSADSAFKATAAPTRWRVREARVERSSDGGTTWMRVELPTTETIVTVTVRNDGTVVVTSSTGRTWTSSDGGTTWTADP